MAITMLLAFLGSVALSATGSSAAVLGSLALMTLATVAGLSSACMATMGSLLNKSTIRR